jgi:hypothetical protein
MSYDPKYAVREPNIEDATNLIGALLRSAGADTLKDVMSGFGDAPGEDATDEEKAAHTAARNRQASEAFVMLLLDALSNPGTRDDILFILADVWQYDPGKVDKPHDDFDYEPDPAKVKAGQQIGRDEMWRSLSTKRRKRLVKRSELGALPLGALAEFVKAFRETVDFSSFLASLNMLSPGEAGKSSTPSPDGTGGQIAE